MKHINIYLLLIISSIMIFSCKSPKQNDNPLLQEWTTPFSVPPFEQIKEEHFEPAFEFAMQEQKDNISKIVSNTQAADFENTIAALDYSGLCLSKVSLVFENLLSSCTSDTLQNIAQRMSPKLSKHSDEIILNPQLFSRVESVYNQRNSLNLNKEQMMLLELTYRNFVQNGAKLNETDKQELMKINERLSLLSLQFGDNLLAETNNYQLVIDDKEKLSGLPSNLIDQAALVAKEKGQEGKWIFTLHNASVLPFLQYADNRELRKEIQTAFINRCNNNNEFDNKANLLEQVQLRNKKAKLLGYENFSSLVLEETMAENTENVYALLNQLWEPALNLAKKEAEIYQDLLKKDGYNDKLQAYDWRYYTEKYRKAKFDLDEECLKPYLSLNNVKNGVFIVSKKLYGLDFIKSDSIPKYHPDVETYEVKDSNGNHLAVLYMDYFPRDNKHGGAWMSEYRIQHVYNNKKVTPIITVNCNFSPPTQGQESLLNFDETETLFHEFGHALHGILSDCTYPQTSGTNVPRDFVELPSQILENWAADHEVLKIYAHHYKTNEIMPDSLMNKLEATNHFNQGFATTEYLAAALLDMYWHSLKEVNVDNVLTTENKILEQIGLIPEIVSRYRSTYFAHIFSGNYFSGYYSYIWSEILDADAFQAFKENGIFDKNTANKFYKYILSNGHKDKPIDMFKNFRGREPKIDALIERRGFNN